MSINVAFYVSDDIDPARVAEDLGLKYDGNGMWLGTHWATSIICNIITFDPSDKFLSVIEKARSLDYLKEVQTGG